MLPSSPNDNADTDTSDWSTLYTGKIDDKWGHFVTFNYTEPLSVKDKQALKGADDAAAREVVERLQQHMYVSNKESLNSLREWRCVKEPPFSPIGVLPFPPSCNGAKAVGCVMYSAVMDIRLFPSKKQLVISVPEGEHIGILVIYHCDM